MAVVYIGTVVIGTIKDYGLWPAVARASLGVHPNCALNA
jgi:hypothetical protein